LSTGSSLDLNVPATPVYRHAMSSVALVDWKSVRASRIERLRAAHFAFLRTGTGRKVGTTEIQHSLILRLASEFQGFARDLHTEAVGAVLDWLCPGDVGRQQVLQLPYLEGRRLDRGNADSAGLAHDFGLLGVGFWHTLGSRHKTARQWRVNLESLNATRNG
jgi:hypothetical protein